MKPHKQGVISGECLLYSAINATAYVIPRFHKRKAAEGLYEKLVGRLEPPFLKAMMIEGTETHYGLHIATVMQAVLYEYYNLTLKIQVLQPLHLAGIDPSPGCVVTALDEPWNHWTVMTHNQGGKFTWLDSYDEKIPRPVKEFYLATDEYTSPKLINLNRNGLILYSV